MKGNRLWLVAGLLAGLTLTFVGAKDAFAWATTPEHFRGIISDYTPLNSAATPSGPYEMRGHWTLDLKRDGKADFSAFMTMELSDYYVWFANKNAADPTIRNQHTHHITLTDAAVTHNPPATACPADAPSTTPRFMISGNANFITGNGTKGPFERNGPTRLDICVTGGTEVAYSNITLVMVGPATGHFGTQPIHGVVRFTHKDDDHDDKH